jgi:hypothetical protein
LQSPQSQPVITVIHHQHKSSHQKKHTQQLITQFEKQKREMTKEFIHRKINSYTKKSSKKKTNEQVKKTKMKQIFEEK